MTSRCRSIRLALLVAMAACARPASAQPAAAPDTSSIAVVASAGMEATPGTFLRADRLQHLSLALAIGVGIGVASREPAAGASSAVTLAIAKELTDDRVDRGDLAAGVAGAALAWLVVAALTR